MTVHQFRLGDRVKLSTFSSANTAEAFLDLVVPVDVRRFASDVWEVTRLLPPDGDHEVEEGFGRVRAGEGAKLDAITETKLMRCHETVRCRC